MNRYARAFVVWCYALCAGVIGGAATAGSAWIGCAVGHSIGADVPVLNLKALGAIMLSAAVSNALLYLKQSPLPPIEKVEITQPKSEI